MALTRIRTSSILDREVREQDLADGAVSFSKINVSAPALPGYVLTTDGSGNLVWNSPTGAVISLDTLTDVDITTVPPTLDQVLAFDGVDTWRPLSIPGLGSSSNIFVVDTIAERNALAGGSASGGDQVFVRTGASGEWEMYLYDAGFPTNPPWVLLATADSARTDANTYEREILYTEGVASPIVLGNISQNSRVTIVTVDVTVAFNDATASIDVGDSGDTARLLSNDFIDLTEIGTYVVTADYVYTSALDTDILVTYNFGTSTQGACRVIVTYV